MKERSIEILKLNHYKASQGFTLVESFVAITILMIVVLGPMSILSSALKDARYIGDEITATFLTQEGIEIMIDKRNHGEVLGVGSGSPYTCDLYYNPNDNADIDKEGYNCQLQGEKTIFSRTIDVEESSVPGQYEITSTVQRTNFPGKLITARTIILSN